MRGFFKRLAKLIFFWIVGIVGVMMLLAGPDIEPAFLALGCCIIGGAALVLLTGFVPDLLKGTVKASVPTAKTAVKIAVSAAKPKPSSTLRWLFTGNLKKKN